jgi:hypothetical protein
MGLLLKRGSAVCIAWLDSNRDLAAGIGFFMALDPALRLLGAVFLM